MAKDKSETRTFNITIPKETWLFLKNRSALQGEPMVTLILRCVDKWKKKHDEALTHSDTNV